MKLFKIDDNNYINVNLIWHIEHTVELANKYEINEYEWYLQEELAKLPASGVEVYNNHLYVSKRHNDEVVIRTIKSKLGPEPAPVYNDIYKCELTNGKSFNLTPEKFKELMSLK